MTVQALRRGRPEVLADLLDRYGPDMQAVAYLIVRDRLAAEDIVADSLLAALDHGRNLRDEDALRPWLLRIATNRARHVRPDDGRRPRDVGVRLTRAASAHGFALALPEKVELARPTGVGRVLPTYEIPIEGRDEWLAAARRLA